MKKGKAAEVATIAVTPEMTTESLREVLYAVREKAEEEIDQLDSMLEPWDDSVGAIPKILLSVHFLMNWYTQGVNGELPGQLSNGLSLVIRRCSYETARRFAECEDLLNRADLEQKIKSKSKSINKANRS